MKIKVVQPERNVLRWVRSHAQYLDKVLDVGCGERRYSQLYKDIRYTGVDAHASLNPTICLDLNTEDLSFPENSFELVLMLDFVEHVEKERSLELIEQCKRIASREILVMTPKAWDVNETAFHNPESVHYQNEYVFHKSRWDGNDFQLRKGWTKEKIMLGRKETAISQKMMLYRWLK